MTDLAAIDPAAPKADLPGTGIETGIAGFVDRHGVSTSKPVPPTDVDTAGLEGIREGLDPGDPNTGTGHIMRRYQPGTTAEHQPAPAGWWTWRRWPVDRGDRR